MAAAMRAFALAAAEARRVAEEAFKERAAAGGAAAVRRFSRPAAAASPPRFTPSTAALATASSPGSVRWFCSSAVSIRTRTCRGAEEAALPSCLEREDRR